MALRKTIRTLAGTKRTAAKSITEPLNQADVAVAIAQLQESVNELVVRFNAHTHSANGTATTALVTGAAQADAGLFTP